MNMKISNRAATAYETYLSKGCAPSAPKELRDARLAMNNALNAYLDAIVEHEWACGYSYAMQQMENGSRQKNTPDRTSV